tara:strand:- start:182 stop:343 length:162 start_codon:yes stop_codon:yes gene_type:complete
MKIEKVSIKTNERGEKRILMVFGDKKVVESENLEVETQEKLVVELKIEKTGRK